MTVYWVISLPKIPYIHRIYMALANPTSAASVWYDNYRHYIVLPMCLIIQFMLCCTRHMCVNAHNDKQALQKLAHHRCSHDPSYEHKHCVCVWYASSCVRVHVRVHVFVRQVFALGASLSVLQLAHCRLHGWEVSHTYTHTATMTGTYTHVSTCTCTLTYTYISHTHTHTWSLLGELSLPGCISG